MESLKEMWSLVCERLNASCGEVIHDIWFKPLEILSFDGTRAEIAASEFKKKIIEQKFYGDLKAAFKDVMGFDVEVVLVDPNAVEKKATQSDKTPSTSLSIEKNTFDTFVVGSSNRFAHAAA